MRFFYITLLILGAAFLMPDFAFAVDLPSECPIGDYNVVTGNEGTNEKDFIFVDNNNSVVINGGNGGDCILIGNNNTAEIKGGNGVDTIIVGYDNTGNILGNNGADTMVIGEGNTGTIDGENGPDIITTISRVPAPSASPSAGSYSSFQSVSLISSGSASVRYSTDGVPSCFLSTGNLYSSFISIQSTQTIKTVACSTQGFASAVSELAYVIELKTDSADLSSILEAVFAPAPGASISLSFTLTLSQDLEINTTASGSKVVLNEATVITRADGLELNAASLSSSETDIGSLAGLAEGQVFEGALQWGIPSITLEFNPAITISIFVGTDLNGQTLDVVRSVDGVNWTNDGIEPPATCTVANGICSFQATKASYYATYTYTPPAPAPVSNSGGGGGTIWFPALYNPVSTTTSAPEVVSTPVVPVLVPEITPAATPAVIVAVVPKKVVQVKISKVQSIPEPAKIAEKPQQPEIAKKNLLSNIFTVILGLFRWPF